jgi:hypothetical protein
MLEWIRQIRQNSSTGDLCLFCRTFSRESELNTLSYQNCGKTFLGLRRGKQNRDAPLSYQNAGHGEARSPVSGYVAMRLGGYELGFRARACHTVATVSTEFSAQLRPLESAAPERPPRRALG